MILNYLKNLILIFGTAKQTHSEFRTLYQGNQYRLLAFWDKTSSIETLVVSTHGFVKKRSKVPENDIQKAINIKATYFEEKQLKTKKK